MKKVSLLALFALVVFCAGCATTGVNYREVMHDQYVQGEQAYDYGDYAKAMSLLMPAAEAGNPNAQYLTAIMYDFGRGVPTNHEKANEWYLRAAEQGQDDAQYNLAISYKIGEGIEQDDNMAVYWLSKSAANGDMDAIDVLTSSYANRGNADAQYALAQVYKNGVTLHEDGDKYPNEQDNMEIEPDLEKYNDWLQQAADNGSKAAKDELAAGK